MKKLLTLSALIAFSAPTFAGFQGNTANTNANSNGGFVTSSKHQSQVKTVAQAKKAEDDRNVVLTGYITKQIANEKYNFKDRTGQITVEIDDELWNGLTVNPKTKVKLYGQVDHDNGRVEIDVKRISK